MPEGPPLEILQDALARIRDDGELAAATPAMARWLAGNGVTSLATLQLDAGQLAALQAGQPVIRGAADGCFELQRFVHAGCHWLRVRDVGERSRAQAATAAAARARSLGGLAGSIAHDLNNQLNAAIGLASMLAPLARDEHDREALRALEKAVLHGARLTDTTARLLRRSSDRRATASAAAVLADVMTMVKKALDVAEVMREVGDVDGGLQLRGVHDDAVHGGLLVVMALLEGRPRALRIEVVGERCAVADGRERDVVVLRLTATGLPGGFRAMFCRLCDGAPGLLGLGAGLQAFAGLVGVVLAQRRSGGEVSARQVADELRIDWVWPRAG